MSVALQKPSDTASDYSTLLFVIQQALLRVQTATPVRVVAVTNSGDLSPVGTVDVVPLVNQVAGDGSAVYHRTIHKVPYSRMQGGANAIVMDPQVGDIGVCVFASRDISVVKTSKDVANPGSARIFDYADGIYIGGILNGAPTQVVQFSTAGIHLLSPVKVTIEAPAIELKGDVTATNTIVATGDVTGAGTSLHTHQHTGVTPGGGNTGPPL